MVKIKNIILKNDIIKVKNTQTGEGLFHYAHFLCECLFIEVIYKLFKYCEVIRLKSVNTTLGNFKKIYEEVMLIKNKELLPIDYKNLNVKEIKTLKRSDFSNKKYFDMFRNYIFNRYNIEHLKFNSVYPEVILIKRGSRINLIYDQFLKKLNKNITTGKERREINNIEELDEFLENKYKDKYKSLYFENIEFKEQVKYFNNAKFIICAHGAVMSNMFFCKENTYILEITCNKVWEFFDIISKILNLNHIKCHKNKLSEIIKKIEQIKI